MSASTAFCPMSKSSMPSLNRINWMGMLAPPGFVQVTSRHSTPRGIPGDQSAARISPPVALVNSERILACNGSKGNVRKRKSRKLPKPPRAHASGSFFGVNDVSQERRPIMIVFPPIPIGEKFDLLHCPVSKLTQLERQSADCFSYVRPTRRPRHWLENRNIER